MPAKKTTDKDADKASSPKPATASDKKASDEADVPRTGELPANTSNTAMTAREAQTPRHQVKGETQPGNHVVPDGEWPLPTLQRQAAEAKRDREVAEQHLVTLKQDKASDVKIKSQQEAIEDAKRNEQESAKLASKAK